jgi:hypothetical protein
MIITDFFMEETSVYDFNKLVLDREPRPVQKQLLDFTVDCVKSNKKFIIVDAPTGCLTKNEKINIYILKDKCINGNTTNNKCT